MPDPRGGRGAVRVRAADAAIEAIQQTGRDEIIARMEKAIYTAEDESALLRNLAAIRSVGADRELTPRGQSTS